MAWEEYGGRIYYYRKRWRNGTCRSEYVGSGWLGDLAEALDERERSQQRQTRQELARFIREQQRVDRAIDDYSNQVRQVVAQALQQLGYHRHKRQWRKRRKENNMSNEIAPTVATKEELSTYKRLFIAAQGKKAKSPEVKQLQEYADEHLAVFDQLSGAAYGTLCGVIEAAATDEATRVHLHGEVRNMKRGLGINTATPLEEMLINDVVLAWVRLQAMEALYTAKYNTGNGVTLAYGAYLENRLSATQRRYLRAVESLARVRRLLMRAGVQINMAEQQVVMNN